MLINATYFQGKLDLPQRNTTEGEIEILQFIDDYEPEFLIKALGYDLYTAFMAGLENDPIEQRWLDLLNGATYQWNEHTRKWLGFLPLSTGSSVQVSDGNELVLTVGGEDEYDPVEGTSFILPPDFVGTPISVEIRGTGTLKKGTEYIVEGNILSLLTGLTLNLGTVVVLKKNTNLIIGTSSVIKKSPIANYVYYQLMEAKAYDMTLIGTVSSTTDNNRRESPMDKMISAWNRMVDMLHDLALFLYKNRSVYPEWKKCCHNWHRYYSFYGYYHFLGDYNYVESVYCKKNGLDL